MQLSAAVEEYSAKRLIRDTREAFDCQSRGGLLIAVFFRKGSWSEWPIILQMGVKPPCVDFSFGCQRQEDEQLVQKLRMKDPEGFACQSSMDVRDIPGGGLAQSGRYRLSRCVFKI